jgi:hypothetical protein
MLGIEVRRPAPRYALREAMDVVRSEARHLRFLKSVYPKARAAAQNRPGFVSISHEGSPRFCLDLCGRPGDNDFNRRMEIRGCLYDEDTEPLAEFSVGLLKELPE